MFRTNQELIKELSIPPPGYQDLSFPTKYAQNFLNQCMANTWKQYRSYWKNPPYNAMRYLMTALYGVVFGTVFWRMGKNVYDPNYSLLWFFIFFNIILFVLIVINPWVSVRLDSGFICFFRIFIQRNTAGPEQSTRSHLCLYFLPWSCKFAHSSSGFFYRKDSLLSWKGCWDVLSIVLCICYGIISISLMLSCINWPEHVVLSNKNHLFPRTKKT